MRIDGYVVVKNGAAPISKTEDEAWGTLIEAYQGKISVDEAKARGWSVVRVGDVDSIRDEALEEAAAYFDTAECSFCVVANENCGDGCEAIATAIRKYLAMKAKP